MSLASDDLEHVIVVPGRHFAPTASAGLVTAISGNEVAGGGAVAHYQDAGLNLSYLAKDAADFGGVTVLETPL